MKDGEGGEVGGEVVGVVEFVFSCTSTRLSAVEGIRLCASRYFVQST